MGTTKIAKLVLTKPNDFSNDDQEEDLKWPSEKHWFVVRYFPRAIDQGLLIALDGSTNLLR